VWLERLSKLKKKINSLEGVSLLYGNLKAVTVKFADCDRPWRIQTRSAEPQVCVCVHRQKCLPVEQKSDPSLPAGGGVPRELKCLAQGL
jgi:hypothetical protein